MRLITNMGSVLVDHIAPQYISIMTECVSAFKGLYLNKTLKNVNS